MEQFLVLHIFLRFDQVQFCDRAIIEFLKDLISDQAQKTTYKYTKSTQGNNLWAFERIKIPAQYKSS